MAERTDGPKGGWGSEALSLSPSLCVFIYLFACLSVYLSLQLSILIFLALPLYLSLSLSPSIWLAVCPSARSLSLPLSLSISLDYLSLDLSRLSLSLSLSLDSLSASLCLSPPLSLSFSLFFLSQSTPLGIRFSISAIFYCPDRLRIPCYTCVSIGFLQCPAPSLNFQLAPQEAVVWRTEPSARGTAGRPWLISGIRLFLATWQFQSDGFPDL